MLRGRFGSASQGSNGFARSSVTRYVIAALVLVLLLGGAIGYKLFKRAAIKDYLANRGIPAVHVNAARVEPASWHQELTAIGSLRARSGVEIRSEVEGVIRAVHVQSGQAVKTGDLLVELDDTVDQATLKSARVRLAKAQRDFERDRTLFERKLTSADKFDTSRSEYEAAEALVEETQGIIDKKTIRAPFDGTLGIHNLVPGQYLDNGGDVVSLQALELLYLDLYFPEKELANIKPGQEVLFTVPSFGGREFRAVVRFVDAVVETTTRNVQVRAEVDNKGRELLPGMFANARLIRKETSDVLTLPREAVAFTLYGESVYVLKKNQAGDWQAHLRTVTSGDVRDGRVVVKGVKAGSLVAADTQHRLLDNSPVVIENLADLNAAPAETE